MDSLGIGERQGIARRMDEVDIDLLVPTAQQAFDFGRVGLGQLAALQRRRQKFNTGSDAATVDQSLRIGHGDAALQARFARQQAVGHPRQFIVLTGTAQALQELHCHIGLERLTRIAEFGMDRTELPVQRSLVDGHDLEGRIDGCDQVIELRALGADRVHHLRVAEYVEQRLGLRFGKCAPAGGDLGAHLVHEPPYAGCVGLGSIRGPHHTGKQQLDAVGACGRRRSRRGRCGCR